MHVLIAESINSFDLLREAPRISLLGIGRA